MRNWLGSTLRLQLAAVLALTAVLIAAPSAGAYGNTALWQIGVSFNCTSPTLCAPNTGGGWGWAEFDAGGLGDATLSDCDHLIGGPTGAVPPAGAQASKIDITAWHVGAPSTPEAGTFVIDAGMVTYTGHTGGAPVSMPLPGPFYTGIPAAAGHYSTADFLGFSAPGIAFQVQVAQMH